MHYINNIYTLTKFILSFYYQVALKVIEKCKLGRFVEVKIYYTYCLFAIDVASCLVWTTYEMYNKFAIEQTSNITSDHMINHMIYDRANTTLTCNITRSFVAIY